jgi:hypothetical protein
MARSVLFSADPESHDRGDIRLDMLSHVAVPFRIRNRLFKEESPGDPSCIWRDYCRNPGPPSLQRYRKTISEHIFDFIEWVEENIPYKESGLHSLSWEFAYHIRFYETEDASWCTMPLWIVTIRDRDGDCVHKNWQIRFDNQDCNLTIRRLNPELGEVIYHWRKPEERILTAICSHLRIKNFIHNNK